MKSHNRWGLVGAVILMAATSVGTSGCSEKSNATAENAALLQARLNARDAAAADAAATLAATDDTSMPQPAGAELEARMRHLLEALTTDNADLASDAMFPRDGYVAMKESSDPQKAWEKRILNSFHRSVDRMHKHMKGISNAKFVSFELGHAITQLSVSKKNFKKPLWRVKHSKLTFTIDGKMRHLDVTEMTGWRGAWYVTRLRG